MADEKQPKPNVAGEGQAPNGTITTGGETSTGTVGTGGTGGEGEAPGAEEVTLTKKKLQATIDREVSKAIATRTATLEKQVAELTSSLSEAERRLAEGDLSLAGKLEVREREVRSLKGEMSAARAEFTALAGQLMEIVTEEIDTLSEEDREIALKAFPDTVPALTRLRGIRALRNAGKLVPGGVVPERPGPGTVGTVTRVVPPGRRVDTAADRQAALGRDLARDQARDSGGVVPKEWEGR